MAKKKARSKNTKQSRQADNRKKVVVIIPTYNERENIQNIVPQIFAASENVSSYDVHVLVVDDTSPDKTYEVVRQMKKKWPRLHLLVNPNKSGLGGAYLKGMREAFGKLDADYIFEFDADGSHDPARIPAFLAKLDEGYDFVIGGRYKDGGSIDPAWPLIRKFYSVVGNIVIMCVLTDFRIRDWTSGYRAISKRVYEAVVPEMKGERFSGYTWQIGFLHKAVRKNFRICEVPIHFVDRKIGQSKLGSEYIKNTLLYIFKARFDEIVNHRVFKFVVAGGSGAMTQLISFLLLRLFTPLADDLTYPWAYQVANFLSIEFGGMVTFAINNIWTFKERKIPPREIIPQFIKFNINGIWGIGVQALCMWAGKTLFGLGELFTFVITVNRENIYQVVGIFFGMFINYFIYNHVIWKERKET